MTQSSNTRRNTLSGFLIMMLAFVVYSSTGIFSKAASGFSFLSFGYLACLVGAVGMLGLYAILWQITLKRMPLNKAYLWKSSTIIFSLLFAHLIFEESITLNNISGATFIIIGLIVLAWKK